MENTNLIKKIKSKKNLLKLKVNNIEVVYSHVILVLS